MAIDDMAHWMQRLARPASVAVVSDGAAPTGIASWFGRVTVGEPGERWPTSNGRPLWPLVQFNLFDTPCRPRTLCDIAVIRIFIDPAFTCETVDGGASYYEPRDATGPGWLLRASSSLDRLTPMTAPEHGSLVRPYLIEWELQERDLPGWDDLPDEVSSAVRDMWSESAETFMGSKVGGWPYLVQSEIYWGPYNEHPARPEYAFQIDSDPDHGWSWGGSGVGYFGRGTGSATSEWAMAWQSY